jgi:prefoldin subunit 5
MSHNRNIEELINAFVFSFIITMILITGRDVIQLLNDKIEKLNSEIERLNMLIEDNNIKNNFHLKEIEASSNTKLDDFKIKYNSDILEVNANIVSRITTVCRRQDETIEKVLDIQDTTIKEMLDTVDELNGQMSAVQFNISSIMGHRNEYNNFINNELVAIRSKINELEAEMPVCIGSDLRHCIEIFANPKIRTNILTSDYLSSLNIECLKRLPLVKYIDMIGFNRITINGNHKFISDLTSKEKTYIKQICDERGIQLVNSGF